ncbi:hypothetical protein [Xanthomonas sp. XNM01]|uniref:hypothetical protein n=1 Tax=Xanthomonas sp. XNM01 TaxID=2769289 RepID=UPI001782E797|nr:hypothetical protein [Xanthomonas sp. XNM01]MBD9368823.1 hypothetical protein [Xanthomonas sp. XNM01]
MTAVLSNNLNTIRSKDAERERIAADVAEWERKRGNKIQRFAMGERVEPVIKSMRQQSTETGARTQAARKASTARK